MKPNNLGRDMRNPEIELEIIDGPMKGKTIHFSKNLLYQLRTELKSGLIPGVKDSYTLGSGNENDFIFENKQSRKYQCTIYFSALWGWCIKDELYHWEKGKNYIYFANKKQLENGTPSNMISLFKGMSFMLGKHTFTVEVKNINPNKIEDDIYDSETSLYLEEDPDDHRNL